MTCKVSTAALEEVIADVSVAKELCLLDAHTRTDEWADFMAGVLGQADSAKLTEWIRARRAGGNKVGTAAESPGQAGADKGLDSLARTAEFFNTSDGKLD
eukprot:5710283-Lingulodinium_polyedra.AAC.1